MKKPVIDRNRPLGLYLHIPFCKAKCAYCDFYSLPHSQEKMDAYAAALARHITEVARPAPGGLQPHLPGGAVLG